MVLTIIVFNVSLAIFNIYLISKIYQFKIYVSRFNQFFEQVNQTLPLLLKEIPLSILILGLETKNFKANYQKVTAYQQTIKQLILMIQLFSRLIRMKRRSKVV